VGNGNTEEALEPLVSVLIPTYNRAQSLAATLDSVLAQSYPRIEIVVIDDGSTDATGAVVARYGDRVRYRRKANGGVASARNAGLAEASGELIALLDSDDLCLPERIALQVACLRQFPDVVLCSSDFSAVVDDRVTEVSHIGSYYSQVRRTPGGVRGLYPHSQALSLPARAPAPGQSLPPVTVLTGRVYEQLIWGNFVHPPTIMVRRSTVQSVGAFDDTIPVGTEYDWLIRVSRAGAFAYLGTPLLLYRYSADQLSGPRYSARLALDTAAALRKVRLADPALYRRHRVRLRRRIGACYLLAANAALERDKLAASGHWLRGVAWGALGLLTLKVLAKIALPRRLLRYRRSRQEPEAGSPAA
jgi:glycosyltransferase involved in cell wall biosynthesis